MKLIIKFAIVAVAFGLASAAQAASGVPTVPSPADPYPSNPIATDGSPLPLQGFESPVQSGRSAFTPITDAVVAVPNALQGIVGSR